MIRSAIVLLAAFLLSACAHMPTPEEQAAADYGAPISQVDAEAKAVEFLRARLKDPMSAIYDWQPVQEGYIGSAPLFGRDSPVFGYALRGTVNSKNSYGGYVGATPYYFLFRDGVLAYAARQDCGTYGSCTMMPID